MLNIMSGLINAAEVSRSRIGFSSFFESRLIMIAMRNEMRREKERKEKKGNPFKEVSHG